MALVSIAGTLSLDGDEASSLSVLQQQAADGNGAAGLPLETDRMPTVDAVRIGAKGQAVIIGRANPGAVISVTDDGREWGGAMADGRGEWVFVPDGPLAPQPHTIRIEQVSAMGRGQATLFVGSRADGWSGALAVSQLGDGSLHVLQAGGLPPKAVLPMVGWIEQTAEGRMTMGGVTLAGAMVEVHMDDNLMGRTQADQRGEWRVSAKAPAAGLHHLRVDRIKNGGGIDSTSELPWQVRASSQLTASALDIHPTDDGWVLERPLADGKSARLVAINP